MLKPSTSLILTCMLCFQVCGLDAELDESEITLVSPDGCKFVVKKRVAKQSVVLQTIMEGDANATEIPLAEEAPRDVLEKIVQFLQHHDGNPMKEIVKPIQSSIMADLVSDWDSEFINVDSEFLYKLLKAANYLDIKPLMSLVSAKAATWIRGKTVEDIRAQFKIVNDFNPEEEAEIRKQIKWALEAA